MIKTQYSDILDDTRIDTIKIIRADNGGEFIKHQMQETWEIEGIRLELTVAYAHNQNGVTERANRDILTHAISILNESHLPKKL